MAALFLLWRRHKRRQKRMSIFEIDTDMVGPETSVTPLEPGGVSPSSPSSLSKTIHHTPPVLLRETESSILRHAPLSTGVLTNTDGSEIDSGRSEGSTLPPLPPKAASTMQVPLSPIEAEVKSPVFARQLSRLTMPEESTASSSVVAHVPRTHDEDAGRLLPPVYNPAWRSAD